MKFESGFIKNIRVHQFDELIAHCASIDPEFNIFVDGGAGLGETSNQMLSACNFAVEKILAFEPNPANVAAFRITNTNKVELIPSALGSENGVGTFQITSTTNNFIDNQYHVAGTSFVGKLVNDTTFDLNKTNVKVVKLSDILRDRGLNKIDFLKLDLQGGELDSLLGLEGYLETVKVMWMEYSGQPGLLKFLQKSGFTLFDTEYLFVGKPNDLIAELFDLTRFGRNSIGKQIFFGYRKHLWADYESILDFMKRRRRVIQTDMIVINNKYLESLRGFVDLNVSILSEDTPDIINGIKSLPL
jgi:FkbM family methyltransferase